jgi:hypothetical protein
MRKYSISGRNICSWGRYQKRNDTKKQNNIKKRRRRIEKEKVENKSNRKVE